MKRTEPELFKSVSRFKNILSNEDMENLLETQEKPLPTGIRLNSLKANPRQAIQALSERYGWQPASLPFCPTGWTLTHPSPSPGMTIEHRLGQYYIQDAASMVPASLFDISDNPPLILDMAASPGGKTTHLIDRTQDRGFIIANDASRSRIPALRSVLSSWGGINLAITCFPGEEFGNWYPETFDLILLDAPCSMENLRPSPNHPLRETTTAERLRLQERQTQLLTSGLKALKIGGQLVYATCSLAPEEDEAVINSVISRYGNALYLKNVSQLFNFKAPGLTQFNEQHYHPQLKHALRLWPHLTGMSGFFCTLIIKTDSIPFSRRIPPSREFIKTNLLPISQKAKNELLTQLSHQYGFDLLTSLDTLSVELFKRHDQIFLISTRYIKWFGTLPYEYIGMPLGRWIAEQLQPSHEFFSRFGHRFTRGIIQIPDQDIKQWIDGRDIRHPNTTLPPKGQHLLVTDREGRNLGMGKLLPKRLRNMLPRQLV